MCSVVLRLGAFAGTYALSVQLGFLRNLVKVFPSLATRPLFLTGESYAGTYIVRLTFFNMSPWWLMRVHSHIS